MNKDDLVYLLNELEQYRDLEEDWDWEDAKPIDPKTIETAGYILQRLCLPETYDADVSPLRSGGVSITFRSKEHVLIQWIRKYLVVIIYPDHIVTVNALWTKGEQYLPERFVFDLERTIDFLWVEMCEK